MLKKLLEIKSHRKYSARELYTSFPAQNAGIKAARTCTANLDHGYDLFLRKSFDAASSVKMILLNYLGMN